MNLRNMNLRGWSANWIMAAAMLAASACPLRLNAQQEELKIKHHHYKLIDVGTFGGPSSTLESIPPEIVLNPQGALAGYADTYLSDPFAPNCFNPDCYVSAAFEFHRGVRTELNSLVNGYSSFASSINSSGVIVGGSQNAEVDPLTGIPEVTAVLWKHGITNLGTLGGNQSVANAINDRGQVVGAALNAIPDPLANSFSLQYLFVPAATQAHAFLWTEARGMEDLGTLGGPDSTAVTVNQQGQIAGQSYTNTTVNLATGFATIDPFLWDKGKLFDLGTLGGTLGFSNWLNNRGQVVGQSNVAGDAYSHPFLWDRGTMRDLGTLGGSFGGAQWINDAGEVVGFAATAGDQIYRAFLWRNGMMTDLGSAPGDSCSAAFGINAKGQVVGGSSDCGPELIHASLWENNGSAVNLNALVSPGSGLIVKEGDEINDRGEIAGKGLLSTGEEHAVLLIPCDEDHPEVEGCDYETVDAETAAQLNPASITKVPVASPAKGSPGKSLPRFQFLRAGLIPRYGASQSPLK